ncbi:MAG: hypothetical protein M3O34_12500 [Chloroflexota bacterium]|nr:hypothetical protein [Chloroflexota bacterium]
MSLDTRSAAIVLGGCSAEDVAEAVVERVEFQSGESGVGVALTSNTRPQSHALSHDALEHP